MEGATPPTEAENQVKEPETSSGERVAPRTPEEALEVKESNGTKSALDTEVVLEHLFGFLSIPDLCSLRQVCRVWNEEAIPHLKKRSQFIYFVRRFRSTEELVRKFIACAQLSGHFPGTNLSLDMYDSPVATWNNLMGCVAPWLTSLFLNEDTKLVLPPETTFPQLTTVKFDCVMADNLALFLQVLENAPNVSTLKLNDWAFDNSPLLRQISQVKSLQLTQLSLEYWEYLKEEVEKYWPSVLDFLESQRHSLQTLHLTIAGNHKLTKPNFNLPILEKLSLCWTGQENVFQNLLQHARNIFPKLRSLCLQNKFPSPDLRLWEPVFRGQKAASSVTHLSILGLRHPASQQLFRENAAKLFPQVTRLEIHEGDAMVWNVLELVSAFEKLEELSLEVSGATALAMALTGEKQEEECRRTVHLTGDQLLGLEMQWRCKIMETEPYRALHRLRVLKFKYVKPYGWREEFSRGMFPLTESLGRLLSIQMPNLKLLHLKRSWEMRGPRPLPPWMAEMERNTTIIFN